MDSRRGERGNFPSPNHDKARNRLLQISGSFSDPLPFETYET
jgi:hypothetical protein